MAPAVSFDASVPEGEREAFTLLLFERLDEGALSVFPEPGPHAPSVSIEVSVEVEPGRGDHGAAFFAAVARARITLHRAEIETRSGPGVARTREAAVRLALSRLVEKVVIALTY